MTREEFAERMEEAARIPDAEAAHSEAVGVMCELLRELGYHRGVDFYTDWLHCVTNVPQRATHT